MVRNAPGELQRQHITQRGSTTVVQGELLGVIHGALSPNSDYFGSLLVFQFDFVSLQPHRRLKFAAITITFADAEGREEFDPEVFDLAPKGLFTANRSISSVVTTTRNGGVREEEVRESAMTLSGAARFDERAFGTKNAVKWILMENAELKDGISGYLRTAVLLRRRKDHGNDRFIGKFHLETEDAGGSIILNTLGRFFRSKPMDDDPVVFDPSLPPTSTYFNHGHFEPKELGVINLAIFASFQTLNGRPGDIVGATRHEEGEQELAPLLQIDEGKTNEQILFDFSRGLHSEVWYKFKRFETLSLLNLYHYQDKLVKLDKKIKKARGDLDDGDVTDLANFLREYRKL